MFIDRDNLPLRRGQLLVASIIDELTLSNNRVRQPNPVRLFGKAVFVQRGREWCASRDALDVFSVACKLDRLLLRIQRVQQEMEGSRILKGVRP